MRPPDADGEKRPTEALVFAGKFGERVGGFRTAWVTAVLKAHGGRRFQRFYMRRASISADSAADCCRRLG